MRKKMDKTLVYENDYYPVEKIATCAFNWAVDNYKWNADVCFDSPIEALFMTALETYVYINPHRVFEKALVTEEEPSFEPFIERVNGEVLYVRWQVVIIDEWPVDFLVTISDKRDVVRHLVVECDGHDFHERTKDQAKRDRARDRKLQELGYTVFRFTGSEIWNDPIECALQVVEWAERAFMARDK